MNKTKVCVAICTYNRPTQLKALLDGLLLQDYGAPVPVIIIDNGTVPASEVIAPYVNRLQLSLERIPEAGLAAVRNCALRSALEIGCEFIAFIDDDEVPVPNWLTALVQKQSETNADLVFGPVLATYHGAPPNWVVEGGFFERWGDTPGTGNALIRLSNLPKAEADWFQPAFALTGGEDAEFFDRLMAIGATSAIAPDAIAHEDTPPSRTTVRYIWRRGLRDGVVIARRIGLRDTSAFYKVLAGTGQTLAKLAYALNHMTWAMFSPWRGVKAMGDLGSALAIPLYAAGYRFQFYGTTAPIEKSPRPDGDQQAKL